MHVHRCQCVCVCVRARARARGLLAAASTTPVAAFRTNTPSFLSDVCRMLWGVFVVCNEFMFRLSYKISCTVQTGVRFLPGATGYLLATVFRLALWPTQPTCNEYRGLFPRGQTGRSLQLTTHPS
jgi:hypothetical protein